MHPSKRKGTRFEQEVVRQARARGLYAIRSKSSDGRTLGLDAKVDILLEDLTAQAKRKGKLPKAVRIPEEVDMLIGREDRGEAVVVLPLNLLIDLMAERRQVLTARAA